MELAVGAGFGALHEVRPMFLLGISRLVNRGDGDGQRGHHQVSSAKHLSSSNWKQNPIPEHLRLLAVFVFQQSMGLCGSFRNILGQQPGEPGEFFVDPED